MMLSNILPVTLGNMVGAMVVLAGLYGVAYGSAKADAAVAVVSVVWLTIFGICGYCERLNTTN